MAKARVWDAGSNSWIFLDAKTAELARNSEQLGGQLPAFYAKQSDMTQAQTDITALKTSYDAAKVLTNIAGGAAGNYTANELLTALKTTTDSLVGGGAGSVDSKLDAVKTELQSNLDAVKNAPIRDRIKALGTVAANGATVTITSDLSSVDSKLEKLTDYFLYDLNNKPLLDVNGVNISYNFQTGALSGVPTMVVIDDPDLHTTKRVPVGAAIDFKVFPIGVFTFAELESNEDFLLDNEELNTAVYADAIDKIVVGLANDSDLIDAVKALIGTQAVQDQIKLITDALAARITANESDLATLKGSNTTAGSVAKAVKDASDALQAELNIINGADTVDGSIAKAVKVAKDSLQAEIDTLNGDATVTGSVDQKVKTAKDALQSEIDTINGDDTTAGSIKKAVKDEATRALAAETALSGRVSTLEGQTVTQLGGTQPADGANILWIDLASNS